VDATVGFFSDEHFPFAIIAILILVFVLPPLLLIFYPCKLFSRCFNCCHKRRWHALHTFVEAFQGCYKDRVASFPGRSHLQYLIAYRMQIRRGKAWEIWSRTVTSGRQMVDTRGAVPDEESRSPFLYCWSEGWRPERVCVCVCVCP